MTAQHWLFRADTLLAEGSLASVVGYLHDLPAAQRADTQLFEAQTGLEVDVDLRGSRAAAVARYSDEGEEPQAADEVATAPRGRGRPRLGVVGREVTLLPRHWEWLDSQRGGASAILRRLIDQARKERAGEDAARTAQDRTNRLLTNLAGNLPGFEDAVRALYARDRALFEQQIQSWSADLKRVALVSAEDAWVR